MAEVKAANTIVTKKSTATTALSQGAAHIRKNIGQGLENEPRAGARLNAGGEDRGHDGEAGVHGEEQVESDRPQARNKYVFFAVNV